MSDKPLVSVIVPAHNVGPYLRQCMDSLVYQTLEDIEIIVIENSSTDDTVPILEDYQKRFPEKFSYKSIAPQTHAGPGRNAGFQYAKADYIYHCDADDLLEYRALELLYNHAKKYNHDVVCTPFWDIFGDTKFLSGRIPFPHDKNTIIMRQAPTFWTKLVHRDLLAEVGPVPEKFNFEDLAYSLVLTSYAKNPGYLDKPLYYYFRRSGSAINRAFSPALGDHISGENYALNNCNPDYRNAVMGHIAFRISENLEGSKWTIQDQVVKHLKTHWDEIRNNKFIQFYEKRFKKLKQYSSLPDEPFPCNVFINGFNNDVSGEFLESIKSKAFFNVEQIVILNKDNCDINECKFVSDAFESNDYDFVANYFALKKIYENGGIYLDRRIQIDAPFNYMRYWRSFFARLDKKNYSDWVFGGSAGDETLKLILETYRQNYPNPNYPLADRIRNILTALYEIPQDGRTYLFDFPTSVFAPEVLFCMVSPPSGFSPRFHICSHDYSQYAMEDNYYTLPLATIECLESKISENDKLMMEKLKNVEKTDSYKLMMKLKAFSQSRLGRLPLAIFKKLVKIKRGR